MVGTQFPAESFVNALYGAIFSVAFAFGPVFQIETNVDLLLAISILFLTSGYACLLYQSAATVALLGFKMGVSSIGWFIVFKILALIGIYFLVSDYAEFSPRSGAFGIKPSLYHWFIISLLFLWSTTIFAMSVTIERQR